jgi:uncharacterized membrane protein
MIIILSVISVVILLVGISLTLIKNKNEEKTKKLKRTGYVLIGTAIGFFFISMLIVGSLKALSNGGKQHSIGIRRPNSKWYPSGSRYVKLFD